MWDVTVTASKHGIHWPSARVSPGGCQLLQVQRDHISPSVGECSLMFTARTCVCVLHMTDREREREIGEGKTSLDRIQQRDCSVLGLPRRKWISEGTKIRGGTTYLTLIASAYYEVPVSRGWGGKLGNACI